MPVTVTLTPNALIIPPTSGWTAVGGTGPAVLADVSDATYVHDGTVGTAATVLQSGFTTSALPAGSGLRYAFVTFRATQAAGNRGLRGQLFAKRPSDGKILWNSPETKFTPGVGFFDYQLPAGGEASQALTQEIVDNLAFQVRLDGGGSAAEDHRIYKATATVVYVSAPTATDLALSPTNAMTLTTKPTVAWAYSSPDSLPQHEYRVALWKLSDVLLFPGGRAAFEANAANIFERRDDTATVGVGTNFTGTDALPHYPVWGSALNSTGQIDWTVGTADNATTAVDLGSTGDYVYYVQVSSLWAGGRLAGSTASAFDFTMSVSVPTAPTSLVAIWQRDFQYRARITVTVPAQSLGTFTGRRVVVERKIDIAFASGWLPIPMSTKEVTASAGTYQFYDTLGAVGQNLVYRAKTVLWSTSTSYESASAWTNAPSPALAEFNKFVLRDPYNENGAVIVNLLGDFDASEPEVQGRFRPLASARPVIVSDQVLGRTWQVEVYVPDISTETALDNLRAAQKPLVLQTDMTNRWYWVRMGPELSRTILRQPGRKVGSTRSQNWKFELIEVNAPFGQPQLYF